MKKFLALALAVSLTGCFGTPTTNPNVMTYEETQSLRAVHRGVVISVDQTEVQIDGSENAQLLGGVLGGLAGSQVGQGTGAYVGAGLGAIGGMIAGEAVTAKKELAFVYTIELQRGGILTAVQGGALVPVGSKVLVREFRNGKRTVAVDQSQNLEFQRTKDTRYVD